MRRPLDPRIVNVCLDANALDRIGGPGDYDIARLERLVETRTITIVMPRTVRGEILNPRTPTTIQDRLLPQIFSLPVELAPDEIAFAQKIRRIVQGNARPGRHDADAAHLADAAKYGAGYFITADRRLLTKRTELAELLPPSLNIVTPSEFMKIYDEFLAAS